MRWSGLAVGLVAGLGLAACTSSALVRTGVHVEDLEPGVPRECRAFFPGFWLLRQPGRVVAVGNVCTRLGGSLSWLHDDGQLHCLICGSRYDASGRRLSGPAPESLFRHRIAEDGGEILVDPARTYRPGEWGRRGSFVRMP